MKNINSIQLLNLYKGIATAQSRINKGLEGKALVYALRYIKGAKTKIKKILKNLKNLEKSDKIIKNKKMKIFKKAKEVANKIVKRVKMVMDKLINKNLKNSKKSDKINNVNKKMALPNDFMTKLTNIELDDEENFNNEMDLKDKFSS